MSLHPDLQPLEFLVGTWRGAGKGQYPTIDDFEYFEEISFTPGPDKPFLFYIQRTRRLHIDEPLHAEAGYLRPAGPGRVEMVIASPTGIVEVHTGGYNQGHLHLRAGSIEATPTAKEVTDVERHIEVHGEVLRYRMLMAAVGEGLTPHLEAELHRVA